MLVRVPLLLICTKAVSLGMLHGACTSTLSGDTARIPTLTPLNVTLTPPSVFGSGVAFAFADPDESFTPWIGTRDPAAISPPLVVPEALFTTPPLEMAGVSGATTSTEPENREVLPACTLNLQVPPVSDAGLVASGTEIQ